jgi:hypothetical protein
MKSIQSFDEYNQLNNIVDEAQTALTDGENVGIHYNLAWVLRGYGIRANGREDTVRQGRRLLIEYEKENLK